jgi:DNA-binding XRE family transcriptional regulator
MICWSSWSEIRLALRCIFMLHTMTMKADELKRRREKLGFTQEELAKRLGMQRLSVIRWETGQTKVPKSIELALKQIESQER